MCGVRSRQRTRELLEESRHGHRSTDRNSDMARSFTATKILEIENGDARSQVFRSVLVEEMLAQFMGEAGREFGHPAVI